MAREMWMPQHTLDEIWCLIEIWCHEMAPKIVAMRKICGHKLRTVKRETISPPSPGLLPSRSTSSIDLLGENSKSHRAHRIRQLLLISFALDKISSNHSKS